MSFAHDFWEEFEKLSIDLLKSYFKNIESTKISINRTQNQKDGGYDGIIFISTDSKHTPYKILSESKLRSISSKDLPLSDFSKTLVIAVNMYACEVYIFTNLHFSKETQKRITNFTKATNINVKLMDIFHVIENINNLPFDIKQKYAVLIQELNNSASKHPIDRKTDSQVFKTPPVMQKLIGKHRNSLLKKEIFLLQNTSGILVISGSQGSGKSLFIQHLINSLCSENSDSFSYIDMLQLSNINHFFLTLLSIIWRVDILDIASFDKKDIEEIVYYISDLELSKKAKQVLFDIIISGTESCFSSKDLMYFCLMEYLHTIYCPILKFKKQYLIFHNIDYATDVSKEILLMFLKHFYKDNIVIILEVRNETAATKKFLQRCMAEVPVLDEIKLNDLSTTEVSDYLNNKYADVFKKQELKLLKQICPRTPLMIDQMVQMFSGNAINRNLLDDSLKSLCKLYKNQKYLFSINSNYVNHVLAGYEDEIKICAASIAFMDGCLELNCIAKLCKNLSNVVNKLIDTHLFQYSNSCLKVYHASILEPLKEMLYIDDLFIRTKMYQQLYDEIDSLNILQKKKLIKKIYLALKLNEYIYFIDKWEEVCSDLIKEEDYEVALNLLKEIEENSIFDKFNSAMKFSLQAWILQCYVVENMYNQDEIETYVQDLDELFMEEASGIAQTRKDEYLLWKFKYYLAVGKYHEIIDSINQYNDITPELCYIKALAIKHIYDIDACIKSLKNSIQIFPGNKHLIYSYYDHILSKVFKYDLFKAKKYINKMKPYIDILSLEDIIHFKYNEQVTLFYNGELDSSHELNKLIRESFQNNLPVEQSRICNLMGQYYWCKNNINLGIEYLNKAAELQAYTNHQTYWWIADTNLALLYYELKENVKCIQQINKIFNVYAAKSWKKIVDFFSMEDVSTNKIIYDKEITSFLLLFAILYRIDTDQPKAIVKEMECDNKIISKEKWFTKEYLLTELTTAIKQTSYYFKNHYMIKC